MSYCKCGVCKLDYTNDNVSVRYPYIYNEHSKTYIYESELNLKSILYSFENNYYEIHSEGYNCPDFICHNCFNCLFIVGKIKYENFEPRVFENFNDYTTRYLRDTEIYFREGLKQINDVLNRRATVNVRCSVINRKNLRYSPY